MKKIVFVINTLPNQRCIKRINEFIENGYNIDAYSFVREEVPYKQPIRFQIEIVGTLKKSGGYKGRVKIIIPALKTIYCKYKNNNNIVFYYFGLDIALFATHLIKNKYFYEESDLAQTYLTNCLFKHALNWYDKKIIEKSLETIFTSEGFLKYHFGNKKPENVSILPNRINKECLLLEKKIKKKVDLLKLKIGFVGLIRYNSVINFARVFSETFPHYEFHFFGNPLNNMKELSYLEGFSNIFFHGEFENPNDLPAIYHSIDLVLSTYDVVIENVRYAEPNKLYESIFFQTPIVVSKDTFLAEKVDRLGVGYSINAMNKNEIVEFIKSLSLEDIELKINQCKILPSSFSVDNNTDFFKKIKKKME